MSTMRSLTDDMEYYHKSFGVYHRVSKRTEVFCHWLDTELREIFKGLDVKVTGKEPVRVLSIGPGDGEIESKILRIFRDSLREAPGHVHSTVVEPAADKARLFQERVAQETAQGIELDWKIQTLEAYQNTADNQGVKFHFINSVHSIYYVPDLHASLKDLYERLEPDGMMLIVVVSDKNGMGKIWKRFRDLEKFQQHLPVSADIRAACKSLDIPIAKELPIKLRADITACFSDPEDLTEDGRLLLAFFAHVMHFVRDAPEALRKDVVEFLGTDSCSEKGEGGVVTFIGDWEAFIIKR